MAHGTTILSLPIEIHLYILSFLHPSNRNNYRKAIEIDYDTLEESKASRVINSIPTKLSISSLSIISEIVWRPEFNQSKAKELFQLLGDRMHQKEIEILYQEINKRSIDCRIDYCRYGDQNKFSVSFTDIEKNFLLHESIITNDTRLLSNLVSCKIFSGTDIIKHLVCEKNQTTTVIEFTNSHIVTLDQAISIEIIIEAILSNNITYLAWANEENPIIYHNEELSDWVSTNGDFLEPELTMLLSDFGVVVH
jgi:hypothetical protein